MKVLEFNPVELSMFLNWYSLFCDYWLCSVVVYNTRCHYSGIQIIANSSIMLMGSVINNQSNDVFVIPTTTQLGTQYVIVTSIVRNVGAYSVGPFVFAVMATVSSTIITVSCNSQDPQLLLTYGNKSCAKGGSMNLSLNQAQTVQVGYARRAN